MQQPFESSPVSQPSSPLLLQTELGCNQHHLSRPLFTSPQEVSQHKTPKHAPLKATGMQLGRGTLCLLQPAQLRGRATQVHGAPRSSEAPDTEKEAGVFPPAQSVFSQRSLLISHLSLLSVYCVLEACNVV